MYCENFRAASLIMNGMNGKVGIYKCCLKAENGDVLKEYTIDEWENVSDIFKEIENVFNNDPPETFNKNIKLPFCRGYGDADKCIWPKNSKVDKIEVSLDLHCNVDCKFCGQHAFRDELKKDKDLYKRQKDLYYNTLSKIKGHKLKVLRFTAVGEPLFFTEEFTKYVRELTLDDTQEVEFTTNGSLLNDEIISILEQSPVKFRVHISLNAWDRESYKDIMGRDLFDKVIENINKISQHNILKLNVGFVFCDLDTLKHFEPIVTELKSKGINCSFNPNVEDPVLIQQFEKIQKTVRDYGKILF